MMLLCVKGGRPREGLEEQQQQLEEMVERFGIWMRLSMEEEEGPS
jgi:hypothetical protein